MKALLKKDLYVIAKQMRIFLVLILVFACLPGGSFSAIAVMYAALLPVTALAYDERAKWDSLAAMMPYSPRSIVAGKYVLAYAGVIGAALLSAAAQCAVALIQGRPVDFDAILALALLACLALVIVSFILPLMYRLGVEKGRIALMIIIAAMAAGVMALSQVAPAALDGVPPALLLPCALALAALAGAVSIRVSTAVYRRTEH